MSYDIITNRSFRTVMKRVLLATLFLLALAAAHAQPVIVADGPLEFCAGDSVVLCVEPEYSSYLWNTGSTTRCITVFEDGNYWPVTIDSDGNYDESLISAPASVTVHHPEPTVAATLDSMYVVNASDFVAFQWHRNDEPINGAVHHYYTPEQAGMHTVTVTDTNGCSGNSDHYESGPFPPIGIEEVEGTGFSLHPNPATDAVTISPERGKTVSLYDMAGRSVLRAALQSSAAAITISHLPVGLYTVAVEMQDGSVARQRLVKQ